jgi:exosome complex RNA-binding protein Rrp42 (RNase PH superfamily)
MQQPVVSDCEVAHIRNALLGGVRRDGRGLLEHRQPVVLPNVVPHTDGSCCVDIGGTQVLVNLVVSVAETVSGQGELRVHLDCSPSVVSTYSQSLGGHDHRYRRVFVSWMSNIISKVFGADVQMSEHEGYAEAVLDEDCDVSVELTEHTQKDFPCQALAIGSGYAFVVDADVQVSECIGGNVLGATALCLSSALKLLRLPHVTLHETPNGISVEVDKSRRFDQREVDWSSLPTLVALHWSSHNFLCDATSAEEMSMPHMAIVASTHSGHISHWMLQSFPSKHGEESLGISPSDLRSMISESLNLCDQLREVVPTPSLR